MGFVIEAALSVIGCLYALLIGLWSLFMMKLYYVLKELQEAQKELSDTIAQGDAILAQQEAEAAEAEVDEVVEDLPPVVQLPPVQGLTREMILGVVSGKENKFLLPRAEENSGNLQTLSDLQKKGKLPMKTLQVFKIDDPSRFPFGSKQKESRKNSRMRSDSEKDSSSSNSAGVAPKINTQPLVLKGKKPKTERPNAQEDKFVEYVEKAAKFLIDYLATTDRSSTKVSDEALPGFLMHTMQTHPPAEKATIEKVLSDLQFFVPKMTHWHHPRFLCPKTPSHSTPDIAAELLITHLACPGFIYDASPSTAEMDVAMLNWAGRAMGLPEQFLFNANSETSEGGASLQESVGDSTLCTLMAARWTVTNKLLVEQGKISPGECFLFSEKTKDDMEMHHKEYAKLCVYASTEAHWSIAKNCRLAMLRHRTIEARPQNGYGVTAEQLREKIAKDLAHGLVPCCIIVTLGTKGILASDELEPIARLAQAYGCWLHVDASNVSPFWLSAQYRPDKSALSLASSILCMLPFHSTNMVGVWTSRQKSWKSGFKVAAQYLKPTKSFALDVRDWTIHLNRRFRSMKIWFVYRLIGLKKMREHLEKLISLTDRLEQKMSQNGNVRIFSGRVLNSFCFQYYEKSLKMSDVNMYTRLLGIYLNETNLFCVKILEITGSVVICVCISYEKTTEAIIDGLYKELAEKIKQFSKEKDDPDLLRHPPPVEAPGLYAVESCTSMTNTRSSPQI